MNSRHAWATVVMILGCLSPLWAQTQPQIVEQLTPSLEQIGREAPLPLVLMFGNFTYEKTGMASPFSGFLEDQFRSAILRTQSLKFFPSDVLRNLPPDAPQAIRDQMGCATVTGILSGEFFRTKDGRVSVSFDVTDITIGQQVGRGQFDIPRAWLPDNLHLEPLALPSPTVLSTIVPSKGQLRLSVTTDRGRGAVYFDQDLMTIFVEANMDCYIKVFCIDAVGRSSLLFPNRWARDNFLRAHETVRIPDHGSSFRLRMKAPFGVESVRVFASTARFRATEAAFQDLGTNLRGIFAEATESQVANAETAEASVSYTINPLANR